MTLLKGKFFRWCAVGGVNLGINAGLTALLHEVAGMPEEGAYAVSLAVVFVLNFFTSRHYVFKSGDGDSGGQLLRFLAAALLFRGLEYLAFLLVHTVLGVYYLVAVIGVQVVSFVAKFFFYGKFVFVGRGKG